MALLILMGFAIEIWHEVSGKIPEKNPVLIG